jgi:hypothetical protein
MAFNNVMVALQGAKTTLTTPLGPVCGEILAAAMAPIAQSARPWVLASNMDSLQI